MTVAPPPGDAYSHKGLTYPLGRRGPAPGEVIALGEGIGWMRMAVPGALKHINVWLLDDGAEVVAIDAGLAIDQSRADWEAVLAGPLAGRRIGRLSVTHFHPDHAGLAGWLAARFDAPIAMTRSEYLMARLLSADARDRPPPEALRYWRAAGWDEARIAREEAKGWGRFASVVTPLPHSYRRLQDGDRVPVGGRDWRVVVGSGHSPEHACLLDEAGGVLIAGDQVLPRITSNVSLSLTEPDADPLGDWLASIARLRILPADLLVLPSHGDPFTGLHARLDAIERGHLERLDALHAHLSAPRRAVDCFGVLFARAIDDGVYGLATGEALAHLRHLEATGGARREVRDGVWWFGRAA